MARAMLKRLLCNVFCYVLLLYLTLAAVLYLTKREKRYRCENGVLTWC